MRCLARATIVSLFAVVAPILALIVGCRAPAPRPDEEIVSIPKWTLEIRGRPVEVVTLPAHLEEKLVERSGARAAEYTLHVAVGVPREMRGRDLTLAFPMLPARASMIVDDHKIYALDPATLDGYREPGPQRFRIPGERSDTDSLDFEIVVKNEWTPSAWIDAVPRLSATLDGDAAFNVVRSVNRASASIGLAATAILAIVYGVLFLADRRRVAHGWQCLQAASTAVYPAFALGLTQSLFGARDLALTAAVLSVAAVANVHYLQRRFGLGKVPRAWWLCLASTVPIALVAGGPFAAMRYLVPIALAALMAPALYNFVLFVRAMRARPRTTTLALATLGWPIAIAMGVGDIGWFLGLGEVLGGYHLASAGMALVAVLQAAALMFDHVQALGLNDELRRQIATRSTADLR